MGALGPMLYAAQIGAFSRRSSRREPTRCKYCKSEKVWWRQVGDGYGEQWRLWDSTTGKQHRCAEYQKAHKR